MRERPDVTPNDVPSHASRLAGGERGICSSAGLKFPAFGARNRREHSFPRPIIPAVDARCSQSALMPKQKTKVSVMLSWVVTFLVIALIAGILGFGGIAGVSIEIAKTIFFIAVVLFLVSAVVGLARGRTNV
jgi:uncharacterized membrane protein YtjA (UPF0391 family)